jgi:hypothetical protein
MIKSSLRIGILFIVPFYFGGTPVLFGTVRIGL